MAESDDPKKSAEDAIKEMYERLIRAERTNAVSEINTTLSHEINNPLTAIIINAQIYENKIKTKGTLGQEEIKQFVDIVTEQSKRMKKIMEDIRHMTKVISEEYIEGSYMVNIRKSAEESQKDIDDTPKPYIEFNPWICPRSSVG